MSTAAKDKTGETIPAFRPDATQVVAVGSSSAASGAISNDPRIVRLYTTVNARVMFGTAPVATQSSMPLGAGVPEYFAIASADEVAVIKETGAVDGSLFITGML